MIELTHNWDTKAYDLGTAFGHLAIETDDIVATCDAVRAKGGKVVREPSPMQHGTTVIAFVEDCAVGIKLNLFNARGYWLICIFG